MINTNIVIIILTQKIGGRGPPGRGGFSGRGGPGGGRSGGFSRGGPSGGRSSGGFSRGGGGGRGRF